MTPEEMALTLGDCAPIVSPEALVAAYYTRNDPAPNGYAITMNCGHLPRGTIVEITDKHIPHAYLMLTMFDRCPALVAIAQSACLVDNIVICPNDDSVKDFMLAIKCESNTKCTNCVTERIRWFTSQTTPSTTWVGCMRQFGPC